MNNKEQYQSLVVANEYSIFYKIKSFFKKFFKNFLKKDHVETPNIDQSNTKLNTDNQKITFFDYIRNIEGEETKLLKLQKKYENGEIQIKNLSCKQKIDLVNLYKKQIIQLKLHNARKKKKLIQYRKKMQTAKS